MRRKATWLIVFSIALSLAGCGGSTTIRDGPGSSRIPDLPGDAIPRPEPRSKHGNGRDMGNGPMYEVWGKRYRVMASSAGYRERGVASWYGHKFDGKLTSSLETYDMYAMTAAHKTLPLPTYVHVRNLRNNRSVVVRVNDRGPFVQNRIIDLSYAAALKLEMVRDGTSLVEVTAYNFDQPDGDRAMRTSASPQSTPSLDSGTKRIFVQVGAFGDPSNAERRHTLLMRSGIDNAFVHEDNTTNPPLYRVRIGPVSDVTQYDVLVEELAHVGITDPYLITE